jgi:hypothetical protein
VGRALAAEEERRILDAASVNQSPLIYPFLVTFTWTGLKLMKPGACGGINWTSRP